MGGVVSRLLGIVLSVCLGAGPALQSVPALAEPLPSSDTVMAEVAASAETSPTVVREIVDERTETSKTWLLSNGARRAEIFGQPVHFQDESERLTTIDTTLVQDPASGNYRTTAAPVVTTFSDGRAGEPPVRLESDGLAVSIDMLGVTEGQAVVMGNRARFVVDKHLLLHYEVLSDGVKETLILASADAPVRYEFDLHLEGLTVMLAPGEGHRLIDAAGTIRGGLGSLLVTDSSEGGMEVCEEATMTVVATPDGARVVYDIPQAWLSDPARVFPVLVDPTVQIYNIDGRPCADTTVKQASPTTSFSTSTSLEAGEASGGVASLVKFDLSVIQPYDYVTNAEFKLYQYDFDPVGGGPANSTVTINRATSSWSDSTTWNTKPTSTAYGSASSSVEGAWVGMSATTAVRNWLDGSWDNHGFYLYQTDTKTYRRFLSGEYSGTSLRPRLVVDYDRPNSTIEGVASAYKVGDTVTVTVKANTLYPESVKDIRLMINYGNGKPRQGYVRWSKANTDSGWSYSAASTGYFSSSTDPDYGAGKVTLLGGECAFGGSTNYKSATFVFRVEDPFGDVQANDFDTFIMMDSGWYPIPAWKLNDTNVDILPGPVTSPSYTRQASGWFREVDRDADGKPDTPNDRSDEGRGSVTLAWPASTLADGYRIYAYDGGAYQKVGETIGNSATTWSSEGAGVFPKDSDYVSRSDDSWTDNPFIGAQTPGSASRHVTVPVGGPGGAGVVVSDGSYLYYRTWSTYEGPAKWTKIGSGYRGTTAGQELGCIGPDFSSNPVLSAFYLDGFIYNGFANAANVIHGIPVSAEDGATQKRALTFSQPLVDRTTGASLTGLSGNVLLTANDEHIYSASYNLTGGDTKDGFRIREFDSDGVFLADHDLAIPSYYTAGLLADSDNLYLIEWGGSHRVTKISTRSWKVIGQWQAGWAASREINGCYDPGNGVFWMGALDQPGISRFAGGGLDLRDDPNALYKKTDGESYDANTNYAFRVVPYSEVGELSVTVNAAVIPALDNRTVRVNDEDRDTTAELGEFAGHDLSATLDEGALELAVTDLAIQWWGPEAALSRQYASDDTAVHMLANAPGWRFSFEKAVVGDQTGATLTEADGETARFTLLSGVYHAPNGSNDALTLEQGGTRFVLTDKERTRETYDAVTGRLLSVADKFGNTVTYTWTSSSVTIGAGNDQAITVTLTAGKAAGASYTTSAGTRSVIYATSGAPEVTYFAGIPGLAHTVSYTYAADRLASLAVPGWPDASGATSKFSYDTQGRFTQAKTPLAVSEEDPFARTDIAYPATGQATVTTYADVGTPEAVSEDAPVDRHFTWNPTGTVASVTDPHSQETTHTAWTYSYSPANEAALEVSPADTTVSRTFDSRGNMTAAFDEEGHRTAYAYDALDQLVRETDPRGMTTFYTYYTNGFAGTGATKSEERQLTVSERSKTEYVYDAHGRMTRKTEWIDATSAAVTEYSGFAASGEPSSVDHLAVRLAPGASPVTLTETKVFDAFGNVTCVTNPAGESELTVYDLAGRSVSATDAADVVTNTTRDVLGNETGSHRRGTDLATADHVEKVYDRAGRLLTETYLLSASPRTVDRTVTHTCDASGREVTSDDSRVTDASRTRYDARGNAVAAWAEGSALDVIAAATRTTYDAFGRVTREVAPSGSEASATVTAYYPNGLVSRVDAPDGSFTAYTYDDGGLKLTETVPADGGTETVTSNSYDIGGRLVRSTAPDGSVTTFTYDLLSRQLSACAEGQPASTTVYNTRGWVLSATDADGVLKTSAYDQAGRVTAVTEAGKTTTSTYDGAGRLSTVLDPDGKHTLQTYDAFSRVATETQSVQGTLKKTTQTIYDMLSRVTVTTVQDEDLDTTRTTTVAYPAGTGQPPTTVELARPGTTTTIVIDANGRETDRTDVTAAGTITRNVTAFDAANRATSWTRDDVLSGRVFDAAGRVEGQTGEGFGPVGACYVFDASTGRKSYELLMFTYPSTAEYNVYRYGETGRLTQATVAGVTSTYAYEPGTGNLTSRTAGGVTSAFSYDGSSRVTTLAVGGIATRLYGWDATRGLRTSEGPPQNPTERMLTYSDANRLSSIAAPGLSASYAYDAQGQRTSSVVTQGSTTTTTTFSYEGLTLLRLDASRVEGSTTATWSVTYLADSESGPYAGVYESGTTRLAFGIVTTDRGDVRELTNGAGDPFAFYAHDAYGNPTSTLSRAVTGISADLAAAIAERNILRYAGYAYDAHSGLYYCSQRYYDPATASFITKDPAKADGEESAYQYCGGDPVGKVDPSGEFFDTTHQWTTSMMCTALRVAPRYKDWISYYAWEIDHNHTYWSRNLFGVGYGYHMNSYGARSRLGVNPLNAKYREMAPDSRRDNARTAAVTANWYWRTGNRKQACRWLGYGMHALQDIYSHGDMASHLPWLVGDNWQWQSPYERARGYKAKWRWSRAAEASKAFLGTFVFLRGLQQTGVR